MSDSEYFVYLLECSDKTTYVGATIDLQKRLRQHNGEIKGGARATSIKVKQGKVWNRICYIKNFPDWVSALQFEWAFKFYSRKYVKTCKCPIQRRIKGLYDLLNKDRPTSKAMYYNDWPNKLLPEIVWENESTKELYETCKNDTIN